MQSKKTMTKNAHQSGALAAILSQGKVKPIDLPPSIENNKTSIVSENNFLFDTNLSLDNASLIKILPEECTPWEFANRQIDEIGDINELAHSLKKDGQQEPILVRKTTNKKGADSNIKYDVIFGRRRWQAASMLNIPIIAILKDLNDQDAVIAQRAENKHREPVSPYSEAIHYKTLIDSRCFNSELELSVKLDIPKSSLYDLMSFTKIPENITKRIPYMHKISINLAVTLHKLSRKGENYVETLETLAPQVGKTITSAKKLKQKVMQQITNKVTDTQGVIPFYGKGGAHLYSLRTDSNGAPCVVLHQMSRKVLDINELCEKLTEYIDTKIDAFSKTKDSGAPEMFETVSGAPESKK